MLDVTHTEILRREFKYFFNQIIKFHAANFIEVLILSENMQAAMLFFLSLDRLK